jgi:hypothetical protein
VVLNGHVHNYQRYAAVDPTGAVNPAGITEYVVGTGGESADALKTAVAPNPSPVAAARAFGYQRMTLLPTGWTTQFVRVDNLTGATSVVDSSTGTCH